MPKELTNSLSNINEMQNFLTTVTTIPYAHQKSMLKFAIDKQKCFFLADIGIGKTLPAIYTALWRKKEKAVKKVLVVTPASIKENFANEVRKHTKEAVYVLDGPILWRKKMLKTMDTFFIVTNYDVLKDMEGDINKAGFDMLIADEISYCKNPRAKRSKALYRIATKIPYRIALTGTLLTNSPLDGFMPFKVIDERIFRSSFWKYKERYCIFERKWGTYGDYLEIIGYKNLDEMQRKIYTVSISFKKEKCLGLPPKVYEERSIELPIEMRKRYERMKKDMYLEYQRGEITAQNCLVKLLKLSQITSGFITTDTGEAVSLENNPKLADLENIVNETEEKVIIWCRFRFSIKGIYEKYKNIAVYLDGSVPTEERQKIIDKFQKNEGSRIFIGQIQLGYGFNLTEGTVAIFYENDFSWANRVQSEGRNYRAGQKKKVTYIDLIVKDSIDEHIKRALEKKEDISKKILEILE